MFGRIGRVALSIITTLIVAGLCNYLFGPDSYLFLLLGIASILAIAQAIRKRKVEKALAIIADTHDRVVRFDGSIDQVQMATDIGRREGWVAEPLPQLSKNRMSVRFMPGEGASTAGNLVNALFAAGLARDVQP